MAARSENCRREASARASGTACGSAGVSLRFKVKFRIPRAHYGEQPRMPTNAAAIAAEMREHLEKLKQLRGPQARADMPARVAEVQRWQTARLMRTYADLNANPRYRAATAYFVQDLYGPKDFSARDAALLKLV